MLLEGHKWIPEFEGKYSIDESGKCVSYWFGYPRPLKESTDDTTGYKQYVLCHGSRKYRTIKTHIILMRTFVGPQNNQVIDHIDGNKHNNRLSNLCYVTPKENTANSIKLGTHNRSRKNLTKEELQLIVKLKQEGTHSNLEIADRIGTTMRSVQRVYLNYRKSMKTLEE